MSTRAIPGSPADTWALVDSVDGIEIRVDTANYRRIEDTAGGVTHRGAVRFRYLARTRQNGALWDQGARTILLDQEVSCASGGTADLRTHRAVIVRADGSVLGEQPASGEWVAPPPRSAGAAAGRTVCRLLP